MLFDVLRPVLKRVTDAEEEEEEEFEVASVSVARCTIANALVRSMGPANEHGTNDLDVMSGSLLPIRLSPTV